MEKWLEEVIERREFVRYKKGRFKGTVEIRKNTENPIVSIVIPTRDAWGRGRFPKLMEQIQEQTFKEWELIIVKGDTKPARAKNVGTAVSTGKYILTLDDDSQLPQKETIENLVKTMESDEKIGAVGAGKEVPPYANWLVRRVMSELPRQTIPVVQEVIDSDLIESGCMLLRKEALMKIGGENEFLFRGDDDYIRNKIREAGYRTVIAPRTFYYHTPPDTFRGFIKFAFRNGRGSAITQKLFPQWVYVGSEAHSTSLDSQPPFIKRVIRAFWRVLIAFVSFRPFYILYRFFYTLGYIWGWLRPITPE